MAWAPPGTVSTGDVLTASKWNQDVVANTTSLPRGLAAYAQATASQASVTTVVDLTSLSVTFTALAGRYYLIEAFATVHSSSGGDVCGLIIANSANTVLAQGFAVSNTNAVGTALNVSLRVTPGAGSITYKLRGLRAAGSVGNLTYQPDATTPSFIMVTDIGPA
jgi:hypothetical protein